MTGLSLHTPPLYIVCITCKYTLHSNLWISCSSLLPPPQVFSALNWIFKHSVDLMVEAEVFLSQCALFLVENFMRSAWRIWPGGEGVGKVALGYTVRYRKCVCLQVCIPTSLSPPPRATLTLPPKLPQPPNSDTTLKWQVCTSTPYTCEVHTAL